VLLDILPYLVLQLSTKYCYLRNFNL